MNELTVEHAVGRRHVEPVRCAGIRRDRDRFADVSGIRREGLAGRRGRPIVRVAVENLQRHAHARGRTLPARRVVGDGGPESLAFLRQDVDGGVRQILKVLALVGVIVVVGYIAGTLSILAIMRPQDASHLAGLPDAYTAGFARLEKAMEKLTKASK